MTTVAPDGDRLAAQLGELASFSDDPPPSVTRVVYSDADRRARAWLRERIAAVGLELREDAIGTMYARWPGRDPEAPAVATGSHIDAIPHAGAYDGTVGVLGGLEAIRTLKEAGFEPQRSLELVVFTSEEPTRFGLGCFGSRAMAGRLAPDDLRALRDATGTTLPEAARAAGHAGDLGAVRLEAGHYRAFVELHIEQGPLLGAAGATIGVVEAIAAPATLEIEVRGPGGHAGAVQMRDRRDPLVGAAELVQRVDAAARESGSDDTVATVGRLEVHPGAVNSIPRRVRLSVDCRDIDGARRDRVLAAIGSAAHAIAQRGSLELDLRTVNADPPATCAADVVEAVAAAAAAERLPHRRMVSRAYHDALFMAQVCPTGMIFIPCRDGVSHRPDEYAAPADIAAGVRVLARTMAELASR